MPNKPTIMSGTFSTRAMMALFGTFLWYSSIGTSMGQRNASTYGDTNSTTFETGSDNLTEMNFPQTTNTDSPPNPATTQAADGPDCSVWAHEWSEATVKACPYTGPIVGSFLTFLTDHLSTLTCGDPDSESRASQSYHCSIQSLQEECGPQSKQQPLTTASDRVIATLCGVNETLNWPCLMSQIDAISECIQTETKSYLDYHGMQGSYEDIETCSFRPLVIMCTWETLEERCDTQTASPIVSILGHQLAPAQCPALSSAALTLSFVPAGWTVSVLLLTTAITPWLRDEL